MTDVAKRWLGKRQLDIGDIPAKATPTKGQVVQKPQFPPKGRASYKVAGSNKELTKPPVGGLSTSPVVKPHKGRIANWVRTPFGREAGREVIWGDFLDHPTIQHGKTSYIVSLDTNTGELETVNSRYTLVTGPVEFKERRIDSFPMKGDKVRFLGSGGYPYELAEARTMLRMTELYTVEKINVGNWSSWIRVVGINRTFNTVMFAIVERADA